MPNREYLSENRILAIPFGGICRQIDGAAVILRILRLVEAKRPIARHRVSEWAAVPGGTGRAAEVNSEGSFLEAWPHGAFGARSCGL
jgi:hypothetical protein